MKVKEMKKLINSLRDEDEIVFYVFDYEYDEENPQDLGTGKFLNLDKSKYGNYFKIAINK